MMRKICLAILLICLIFCNWQLAIAESELETSDRQLDIAYDELEEEYARSLELEEKLKQLNKELDAANTTISDLSGEEYTFVYIGDFKITHYCTEKRKHICGTGTGLTATGTQVTAGRTIAVDPNVIPYGSKVYIEGYGFRIAEDCGGAVKKKHIDIAVETHEEALQMGVTNGGVWILVEKTT